MCCSSNPAAQLFVSLFAASAAFPIALPSRSDWTMESKSTLGFLLFLSTWRFCRKTINCWSEQNSDFICSCRCCPGGASDETFPDMHVSFVHHVQLKYKWVHFLQWQNMLKVNSRSFLSFGYLMDQRVRFKLSGPGMKKKTPHTHFCLKSLKILSAVHLYLQREQLVRPQQPGVWFSDSVLKSQQHRGKTWGCVWCQRRRIKAGCSTTSDP